ncbi:MAG: hypothetical protein WCN95_08410 [bacterium]
MKCARLLMYVSVLIAGLVGCVSTDPNASSSADAARQETSATARLQPVRCLVTPREKLLLRAMLQRTIYETAVQMGKSDPEIAEFYLAHKSLSDRLAALANPASRQQRRAVVHVLGSPYSGEYDPAKAAPALEQAFKTENDKWLKLDIAVVLSSFGDPTGRSVLVSAYEGKDGYRTSSEFEVGAALMPLLLLDYGFPDGIARRTLFDCGGLSEYLDKLEKQEAGETEMRETGRRLKPSELTLGGTNVFSFGQGAHEVLSNVFVVLQCQPSDVMDVVLETAFTSGKGIKWSPLRSSRPSEYEFRGRWEPVTNGELRITGGYAPANGSHELPTRLANAQNLQFIVTEASLRAGTPPYAHTLFLWMRQSNTETSKVSHVVVAPAPKPEH